MSLRKCDYKVFLYLNDYNMMCNEVFRHQHIETGGNLFGLWTKSGDVVVHVALGPGKKCRRTSVSFHQDIKYLKRVGRFLNDKFMLCHIGEWHSHHRLSLNEPSSGDKSTVRENYPQGMTRFLVIIGNIVADDQVSLSPYFFSENGETCEKGELEVLEVDSPFTNDVTIARELETGAENQWWPQPAERDATSGGACASIKSQRSGKISHGPNTWNIQCSSKSSFQPNEKIVSHGDVPMTGSNHSGILYPPRDYDDKMVTTSSPNVSGPKSPLPPDLAARNDQTPVSQRDMVLKKIYDEVKSRFGIEEAANFQFERAQSQDIEMKFKHDNRYWLIWFPAKFPEQPAKLYRSRVSFSASMPECSNPIKPLDNFINILLSIKEHCSILCRKCKDISKERLGIAANPVSSNSNREDAKTLLMQLKNEIELSIADQGTLRELPSTGGSPSEIAFMHGSKSWVIKYPSNYPQKPAEVFFKRFDDSCQIHDAVLHSKSGGYGPQKLLSSSLILSAIRSNCACQKCVTEVKKNVC